MTDLCSGQALGDADNDNGAADKSNPYMSPFSRRHNYGEHITLTLGVATWMLNFADCVMVTIILKPLNCQ
jgi:hypothetical protein